MEFKNKTIYIISYEAWGSMLMSKHHYAITLSAMGNEVFFINHPDLRRELKRGQISILSTEYENLKEIKHRFVHPYFLKYKLKFLYNILAYVHVKRLMKKINKRPDVIWSFDTGNSLPISYFKHAKYKILMPVDGPFGHIDELRSAKGANIIVSVTNEILNAFSGLSTPKHRISHGVANFFIANAHQYEINTPLRIGYSGSLLRNDLDTEIFLTLIDLHRDKIFEFWGEFDHTKSNIHLPQDVNIKTLKFIEELKKAKNVILHGPVNPIILSDGIKKMDVLLVCFNIKDDQNHHKILEYLGTGKVVVSTHMSSYDNEKSELIVMAKKGENNTIPLLFANVLENINHYNSIEMQQTRISFANQFTYQSQVKKIEGYLP
jgi:hypothetical protein